MTFVLLCPVGQPQRASSVGEGCEAQAGLILVFLLNHRTVPRRWRMCAYRRPPCSGAAPPHPGLLSLLTLGGLAGRSTAVGTTLARCPPPGGPATPGHSRSSSPRAVSLVSPAARLTRRDTLGVSSSKHLSKQAPNGLFRGPCHPIVRGWRISAACYS